MTRFQTNTLWPVGESYLRQTILDYCAEKLPPIFDGLRSQVELDLEDFPFFTAMDYPGPPSAGMGGDQYGLLSFAVLSNTHLQTIDIDALGQPTQLVQYRCRLYSFVKADAKVVNDQLVEHAYQRVVRYRGLAEAAVRSLLVKTPSMGVPTGFVMPESINGQWADIQNVKGERWVSGVYHEFTYQNEEGTVGEPVGVAEEFDVTVTPEAPEGGDRVIVRVVR